MVDTVFLRRSWMVVNKQLVTREKKTVVLLFPAPGEIWGRVKTIDPKMNGLISESTKMTKWVWAHWHSMF